MLFFRSEEDVRQWCAARNVAMGETLSLEQLWTLSQAWYGNRLAREFHGQSREEAEGIFREVGVERGALREGITIILAVAVISELI